jgi:hypothetical protein
MEVLLKKAKSGDLLVIIRFGKDSNFDVEKMEWCPRLDEMDLIWKARKMIMEKQPSKKERPGG